MSEPAEQTDPPRLVLAPGLRVVRRGRDRLQVGLTPPRRVVLERTTPVREVLHALQLGLEPAPGPEVGSVLRRLVAHGCAVPLEDAARPVVALRGHGPAWPVDVPRLLGAAGLRHTRWAQEAAGVLVLAHGEPARELLDPLLRQGVPHLVVTLVDGGARLGPLVEPGATACLRCHDAHLAETDPEHLAVLERYVEAGGRPRGDGLADAPDAALATLVSGWAVRDLAAHLRGERPATWSSTLRWHPGAAEPVTRRWLRRPGCGCGWAPE
ncbi:hypothetical protein [Nocardioides aequoreus]|uniref:hypothetical protein n=1 Tax=Nocardioides aequoreus TaxID=397278 RepID=UPI0012F64D2C|nr:hypothetical protein [Nocardioides aequoreus]